MSSAGGRSSAKREAYEHVKLRVVNTPVYESAFITEGEIASLLDISRTPVREAFLQLESEHFLRLIQKKGAFVPTISEREMEEVMQARTLLESHAARRLAELDSGIGSTMRDLVKDQARVAVSIEPAAFIDLDRQFHLKMIQAAGNRVVVDLYESLRDRQLRMGMTGVSRDESRMRQTLVEHELIAAAAADRRWDDLSAAIDAHLKTTFMSLIAASREPDMFDGRDHR